MFEEIGAVLDEAIDPLGVTGGAPLLTQLQSQIELGHTDAQRLHLCGEARPVEHGRWLVLHGEHHLEERMPGERAHGIERFDESLERQLLMRVGVQVCVAHAREQFGEGRIAVRVGA